MTTKQPLENTYDYSAEKKMIKLSKEKQTAEQELYKIAEFIDLIRMKLKKTCYFARKYESEISKNHPEYFSEMGNMEDFIGALKLTAEDVREYTAIICNKKLTKKGNKMNEQVGSTINNKFGNATNTGYVGEEIAERPESKTIQNKIERTFELLGRINEKVFFPTPEKDSVLEVNENKISSLVGDMDRININLERIDNALSLIGK